MRQDTCENRLFTLILCNSILDSGKTVKRSTSSNFFFKFITLEWKIMKKMFDIFKLVVHIYLGGGC